MLLGGSGNGVDNWTEASSVRSRRSRSRSHSRNRKENRRPSSVDSSVESRSHRRYDICPSNCLAISPFLFLFFIFLLSLSQKLVFFTRHLHNWLLSLLTNVEIDAHVFFSSSYEFDLNIEMQLVPEMGRSPIANSLLPGSPFPPLFTVEICQPEFIAS